MAGCRGESIRLAGVRSAAITLRRLASPAVDLELGVFERARLHLVMTYNQFEAVVVDVVRICTNETSRKPWKIALSGSIERIEHLPVSISRSGDPERSWRGRNLAFVEHAEPIALFDPEVHDRVLRFVPALDVGLFVHDQGAEVPRVEHDDTRGLGYRVEEHERADQDTESNEVGESSANIDIFWQVSEKD